MKLDFRLALYISGGLSLTILLISVAVFANRLRSVYDTLTENTKRALISFAMSGIFLAMVPLQAIFSPRLVSLWLPAFLCSLIISELHLFSESRTVILGGTIVSVCIGIAVVLETILRLQVDLIPVILIAGLSSLLLAATILGGYLVKTNPSPFTVSIFLLVLVFIGTWISASLGNVATNPEYFMLEAAPLLITAAVLGTILRPWRLIISVALVLLGIVTAISIIIPAAIAGEVAIWMYVICAVFAGLACVLPLNYFIKQALDTGTRTPLYTSITLISVALLAITHSNAWSIALEFGVWDINLLYVDWVIGVVAVLSFTLSSASLLYSERITNLVIDGFVFGGVVFLTLGHPFVSAGRYQLNPLYLPLSFVIASGIVGFILVAYKLRKAGSGGAASRFILFSFASLSVGVVAMFSDIFPLPLTLSLIVAPGIMLIAASPYRPQVFGGKEAQ